MEAGPQNVEAYTSSHDSTNGMGQLPFALFWQRGQKFLILDFLHLLSFNFYHNFDPINLQIVFY